MDEAYYNIVLLIRGGGNPDEISKELNLKSVCHKDDRWNYSRLISTGELVEDALSSLLDNLKLSKKFFDKLRDRNARIDLFINFPGGVNQGYSISPNCMARFVEMGINFGFEIFPDWAPKEVKKIQID